MSSTIWYPSLVPTHRWPSWWSPEPPVTRGAAANVNLQYQGYAVPVPPRPVQCVVSWCGTHPLLVLYPTFLWSFVVRAAAANVNPRTRLSHMTPFSGRDWCTRERCQKIPEFLADDFQNFATGSRISQDFPRIFRECQTTPRARAHTPTHSPTPPLKPSACSTEAPLQPRA